MKLQGNYGLFAETSKRIKLNCKGELWQGN